MRNGESESMAATRFIEPCATQQRFLHLRRFDPRTVVLHAERLTAF